MAEIHNNVNYSPPALKGDNGLILEAHNSSNLKLDRPKITPADFSQQLLTDKTTYSKQEADKRLKTLNNDIYQSAKKEKDKHEFNLKRYFTIFGILALLAAAIGYFRKGK